MSGQQDERGWLNVSTASILSLGKFFYYSNTATEETKMGFGEKSIGLKCQACHLMTVVEEIVFQKYSLLASHHLHGRIVFPCPIDFGFGHVTCFGQWNVGKHNESEDLQCTYPVGIGSCTSCLGYSLVWGRGDVLQDRDSVCSLEPPSQSQARIG